MTKISSNGGKSRAAPVVPTVRDLKRLAKKTRKEFGIEKLSAAQERVAREAGYEDWFSALRSLNRKALAPTLQGTGTMAALGQGGPLEGSDAAPIHGLPKELLREIFGVYHPSKVDFVRTPSQDRIYADHGSRPELTFAAYAAAADLGAQVDVVLEKLGWLREGQCVISAFGVKGYYAAVARLRQAGHSVAEVSGACTPAEQNAALAKYRSAEAQFLVVMAGARVHSLGGRILFLGAPIPSESSGRKGSYGWSGNTMGYLWTKMRDWTKSGRGHKRKEVAIALLEGSKDDDIWGHFIENWRAIKKYNTNERRRRAQTDKYLTEE